MQAGAPGVSHHWSRGTSKSAHSARHTSRGSTPSSMAWAAVRPLKPVNTWSTSSDEPRDHTELVLDQFVEFGQSHADQPTQPSPERVMAHPYRIGHPGHARARRPRGLRGIAARTAPHAPPPPTPRRSAAESAAHCLGAQRDWPSPTGHHHPEPPPTAPRPAASWRRCRARCRRSSGRRCAAVRPGGPARPPPTAATSGPRRPTATPPPAHPPGSTSPGTRHSTASSARPVAPVVAVDGATTTSGPSPGGTASTSRRWARNAADPPRRPRPASPVWAPPGRAASRSTGAPGRDRARAARCPTRASDRCRCPCRTERAVSDRITASRSRPRIPVPGASPLPSGGSPFDGR